MAHNLAKGWQVKKLKNNLKNKNMKTTKTLPAILAALFISASAFATTTTPNYEDWDYENDPLEEVLAMEEIPAIEMATPFAIRKLEIEAIAVKDNFLKIKLPFADNEIIGLVIIDKKGHVVFNEKEEYRVLKTVLIADTGDMEYVVKAYQDNVIYQAKLKVVHK